MSWHSTPVFQQNRNTILHIIDRLPKVMPNPQTLQNTLLGMALPFKEKKIQLYSPEHRHKSPSHAWNLHKALLQPHPWEADSTIKRKCDRPDCRTETPNTVVVVQLLSRVWLFVTPWTPGFPALHCFPEFAQTHIYWVWVGSTSNHLFLCYPSPSLLPSIFPIIRVFSNELTLHIRWPKYWSFSFSISPSNEY